MWSITKVFEPEEVVVETREQYHDGVLITHAKRGDLREDHRYYPGGAEHRHQLFSNRNRLIEGYELREDGSRRWRTTSDPIGKFTETVRYWHDGKSVFWNSKETLEPSGLDPQTISRDQTFYRKNGTKALHKRFDNSVERRLRLEEIWDAQGHRLYERAVRFDGSESTETHFRADGTIEYLRKWVTVRYAPESYTMNPNLRQELKEVLVFAADGKTLIRRVEMRRWDGRTLNRRMTVVQSDGQTSVHYEELRLGDAPTDPQQIGAVTDYATDGSGSVTISEFGITGTVTNLSHIDADGNVSGTNLVDIPKEEISIDKNLLAPLAEGNEPWELYKQEDEDPTKRDLDIP
jgi:hypothetical protein